MQIIALPHHFMNGTCSACFGPAAVNIIAAAKGIGF